ncbi:MAG: tRNA (adenosine(37)-N6)-threonylcarbamoyltransferase complex dimerization subunit type 1 TsaB [Clostridia bacterium]|nr:tRNA (adenosine(37)-N6)-threonylcarbamoyltransferase complex dimerization subunit type 1 TsaB [Clostridia bacterium]
MSKFLAVDTSSRYLTVAAKNGAKTKVNYIEDCAMNHSVVLMGEIEKTLQEVGLTPAECDNFVAVTGPGSFTGIRIGIACVKGFSEALGKKCAGVTVFDMISYNVNSDCDYLVAVDAAHGYYYVCGYTADGQINFAPAYLSFGEVAAANVPVYGFEVLPFANYKQIDVKNCLLGAAEKCLENGGGIEALYVRKSQAEEERLKRESV